MPDPQPDPADEEYFQAIESRFAQLRGTPLLLSPKDVALVDDWWRRRIPLRIVLHTLEELFRRRDPADPVRSLAYCRAAVEGAFSEWRESRLGEGGAEAEEEPSTEEAVRYLQERAADLARRASEEPAFAAAAAAVRRQIDRLRSTAPPALSEVEEALHATEDELVGALLRLLPEADQQALERRAADGMRELRARLTARAWRASVEAAVRAEVRAAHEIPRLTLYLL